MLKQQLICLIYFFAVMGLNGCSSVPHLEAQAGDSQNTQREAKPTNARAPADTNPGIEQHLAEWQTIKPSVERLVAIEAELKELITQLNGMANKPTTTEAKNKVQKVDPSSQQASDNTAQASSAQVSGNTAQASSAQASGNTVQATNPQASGNTVQTSALPRKTLADKQTPIKNIPADKTGSTGYALQLVSLRDQAQIKPTWDELVGKYSTILETLQPIYQQISVNNKTYYRIKAGIFNSQSAAVKACDKLHQLQAGCFVTNFKGIAF